MSMLGRFPVRRILAISLAILILAGCGGAAAPPAVAAAPMPDSPAPEAPAMAAPPPPPGATAPSVGSGLGQSYPAPASPADQALAANTGQPAAAPATPSGPSQPSAKTPATAAKPAGNKPNAAKNDSKTPVAPKNDAAPAPAAPLLIYTGELQMLVDQSAIASSIDRAIDAAEALGGYLAARKDTSVVVRVPSSHFREALTSMEKLGEVTHRSVSAEDVSEQYSDLEVRLQNLRATRQRLQEFLAKSGSMPDMLTVEKELERVAGEIESIEGKMRFLRSRAAFSTITLDLSAKPVATVVAKHEEPPREVDLPIDWLARLGLDTLLNLR